MGVEEAFALNAAAVATRFTLILGPSAGRLFQRAGINTLAAERLSQQAQPVQSLWAARMFRVIERWPRTREPTARHQERGGAMRRHWFGPLDYDAGIDIGIRIAEQLPRGERT